MDSLNFNSVENIPSIEARAVFRLDSSAVFREDIDIVPTVIDDTLAYIPWGGDNQLPFNILSLIEKDETLATCQCFNSEVCYGAGLQYCTVDASASVKSQVEDFTLDNDLAARVAKFVRADKQDPEFVSQRKASKMFGRANVERWRLQGLIEPCERPGRLEYNVAELRLLQRTKHDDKKE